MANTYFQFKQFRIDQDRSAMKVCTDSCWFGARVGEILARAVGEGGLAPGTPALKVLDIGTGTGLLSLMLAQVLPKAQFTAVEIDPGAAAQARENFMRSPWPEQLVPVAHSLHQFLSASPPPNRFDVVITNPPFYANDLEGPDALKNQAHHGQSLPLPELLDSLPKTLGPGAPAFLLLPPQRLSWVEKWCSENNHHLVRLESLSTTAKGKIFRYLLEIRRPTSQDNHPAIGFPASTGPYTPGEANKSWVIKAENNAYTPEFAQLLSPYYLNP